MKENISRGIVGILFIAHFIVMAMAFPGCSTVKHVGPDGTTITYTRFMAGAESIKINLRDGTAEIGKQTVDTELLTKVLGAALGAAK